MAKVVCMKNGRCFDRYISGKLENENQEFEVVLKPSDVFLGKNIVMAVPTADTDIRWKDESGISHTSHLYAGNAIAVPKEFIEETA